VTKILADKVITDKVFQYFLISDFSPGESERIIK